jgi:hypothetical protein
VSLSGMESNPWEKVDSSVRSLDVEHHLDETNEDLKDSLIGCSTWRASPEQKRCTINATEAHIMYLTFVS